ncbi:MAG: DUF3768 domain-containing protein [Pseudomonadota bacterium]
MNTKQRDISELVGAYPSCRLCGSEEMLRDANASWSKISNEWELSNIYDHFECNACGNEITPEWQIDTEFRKKRIRRLNDQLRKGESLPHATVVYTQGIMALGHTGIAEIKERIAAFDLFDPKNDPRNEHDFGQVKLGHQKIFFKIDYFDLEMKHLSPDPANPLITHRVLTIMKAEEY